MLASPGDVNMDDPKESWCSAAFPSHEDGPISGQLPVGTLIAMRNETTEPVQQAGFLSLPHPETVSLASANLLAKRHHVPSSIIKHQKVASGSQECIVRGLKFIDDRTDQEIGKYEGLLDAEKSILSSCSKGQGEETIVVYNVQTSMKEAHVRSIFNATKAAEPKRLRPVSWTPGDKDLVASRGQGLAVEASIGSVIRDNTTECLLEFIQAVQFRENPPEGLGQKTPRAGGQDSVPFACGSLLGS